MATARPFAFNSGSVFPGTTQYGNIVVLNDGTDYNTIPLEWYNGVDEDLGYVITHAVGQRNIGNNTNLSTGNVVGFWRSDSKDEASFLNLFDAVSKHTGATQSFDKGEDAKSWLESNGYWTSFVTTWNFNSGVLLPWPSTTGYTVYSGAFVSGFDDTYTSTALTLPTTFSINANNGGASSNQLYMSTNGQFSLGSGVTWDDARAFNGNIGDNWLEPGALLSDGDTENWWYQTGSNGSKYYVKNIVFGGRYQNPRNYPTSWIGNLYRDSVYQWFETRVKSNVVGNAGPNGNELISSTSSQVWRGDLNGENWVYLGYGSIS